MGLYAEGREKHNEKPPPGEDRGEGGLFGESKWNLCISAFSICEIQKSQAYRRKITLYAPS